VEKCNCNRGAVWRSATEKQNCTVCPILIYTGLESTDPLEVRVSEPLVRVTKVATRSPNGLNGGERLAIYTETPLREMGRHVAPATSYLKGILEAILPHSQLGERKLGVSESKLG
jgi:hypothetical protein